MSLEYGIWLASLSPKELRTERQNLEDILRDRQNLSVETRNICRVKLEVLMRHLSV